MHNGASSRTISRNSPCAIGAGPTTRITSSGMQNSKRVEGIHDGVPPAHLRMSMSCSIRDGTLEAASMRRSLPIFIATARAPMLSRICLARLSGTMPLGAASSTSAAVCAAARRSFSQFSRKLAIDGT